MWLQSSLYRGYGEELRGDQTSQKGMIERFGAEPARENSAQ